MLASLSKNDPHPFMIEGKISSNQMLGDAHPVQVGDDNSNPTGVAEPLKSADGGDKTNSLPERERVKPRKAIDEDPRGRKIIKFHRLLTALTVFNLGLLVFLLARIVVRLPGLGLLLRSPEANSAGSVLRGRGLEITDDDGRVRASIKPYPASVLPDGTAYPETVLLRLISSQGRPNVKIAATEDGSAVALGGEADPTQVAIAARGTGASLKLVNKGGRQQLIKP
jgi:hypothetical protein